MRVTVNDAAIDVAENTTVAALLAALGYPGTGVAVAVNRSVLPRSRWDEAVPAAALVEVVTAVQGG